MDKLIYSNILRYYKESNCRMNVKQKQNFNKSGFH